MEIWSHYSHSIGLTLLYSLWQAALIYLILQLRPTRHRSLSIFELYWPVVTLFLLALITFITIDKGSVITEATGIGSLTSGNGLMPVFLVFWFIGMSAQFIRLSLDYIRLIYWRRKGELTTEGPLHSKVTALSRKLKIQSNIQLKIVHDLTVPMVVGFIKPMILFPFCLVNQLTSEELDGILLHELSHIKRKDYFWNLILRGMEVILFFNPFVHLIIKETRIHREMSCDKVASVISRRPKALANALLRIEEISLNPKLAMSLNSEGQLTQRIYSLLNIGINRKRTPVNFASMLAILAFVPFVFAFEVHDNIVSESLHSSIAIDSITIPGIKHNIHTLEFKTTGGEVKDVRINDKSLAVSDHEQLSSLKSKASASSTSSNRVDEYNMGLEKKYHDARIKARKEKLVIPEFKINREKEEESVTMVQKPDHLNLASIEGYHFGKSFDTLHQWFELTISDEELKSMKEQKHQLDKTYFFHLPVEAEPKAHKDVVFLYEPEIKETLSASLPIFDEFDVDEIMEMMLIEHDILSDAFSYRMTLNQNQLIVNGHKTDDKIHTLFKEKYILLLGKNPSSIFNYQIFKNQVQ